jgi:hypothetical protein
MRLSDNEDQLHDGIERSGTHQPHGVCRVSSVVLDRESDKRRLTFTRNGRLSAPRGSSRPCRDPAPRSRARQKLSGEVGVIVAVQQANGVAQKYDVSFVTGVWQLPGTALSPVYADPFDVLRSNSLPLYPYDGWLRRESLRLADG